MSKIGLILLAAGASTRMGSAKQLLLFGGKPLVRHAAEAALASGCGPVFVVLGAAADAIRPVLQDLPLEVLENRDWSEGMGASVRAGVQAAVCHDLDALLLALADQPHLTGAAYHRLVEAFQATGKPIIASAYAGTVGVPALFSRALFPELLALTGERGCKAVIAAQLERVLAIPCPEAVLDLDTPAEYRRATSD